MSHLSSVFSAVASTAPTCQYYRITTPLRMLEKHGVIVGNTKAGDPKELWLPATLNADAVQLYLPHNLYVWNQVVDTAKLMSPAQSPQGMKFPPVFIWDGDDNTDYLSPFNQSFVFNGTKNVDGTPLRPGDKLTTVDGTGKEIVMWEDGVTRQSEHVFNIADNLHQERLRKTLIRKCHGATAASKDLAAYYRDALGQKHVHVHYNTVFPEDYQYNVRAVRPDPDDVVRIFWQGGQSHLHDWLPLAGAVKEVAKKYPKTKWVFMGIDLPFVYDSIPAEQVEILPWIHYEAYRLRRTLLHVDINLCPLVNNLFNRCKSAIKWYESTVSENMEATLAQNVGPYKEITDGVNGLLFDTAEEFAQKLGQLIEDAELRKRLGAGAKEWVLNNRLPKHTGPRLFEFYTEVKERQVAELAPKITTTVPRSLKELAGGTS